MDMEHQYKLVAIEMSNTIVDYIMMENISLDIDIQNEIPKLCLKNNIITDLLRNIFEEVDWSFVRDQVTYLRRKTCDL